MPSALGTDNDVFTLNVQGQLVRSQRWFWSRRTKQLYRNRYWLTPQVRPKTVKQRHSFALMETLRTCGDSASLQKYVTRQLLDTSGFFKDPSFDQSRAHGTRYLMLARMDALWTARKAIQIGILVDTHPFSVDHCILCDQQLLSTSIAHLVVECEQVTGHRIQSGLVPAIQKSRLRLLGRALDPGVENVYTWLRGGVLNGEADLDQRWLDGTVEHESMGTRHDNRALAARLADFLQRVCRGTLILAKVCFTWSLTEREPGVDVWSIYLGKNDRQAHSQLVERALELADTANHESLNKLGPRSGVALPQQGGRPFDHVWSVISGSNITTSTPCHKQAVGYQYPTLPVASLSNLPLIDTFSTSPNIVGCIEHHQEAIYKAKMQNRAWLASRRPLFESPGNHTGSHNQYTLAEATASRLTSRMITCGRSHCTRIDKLLAGGVVKAGDECCRNAWHGARDILVVDPQPIQ
ncbi:hypothetical protein BASA60_007476 [Batrachochytrium salamandrivorans]|nr:hypothetical protein BASA60_007476 [Batrachochytrium salamandrivorans]